MLKNLELHYQNEKKTGKINNVRSGIFAQSGVPNPANASWTPHFGCSTVVGRIIWNAFLSLSQNPNKSNHNSAENLHMFFES